MVGVAGVQRGARAGVVGVLHGEGRGAQLGVVAGEGLHRSGKGYAGSGCCIRESLDGCIWA